ncbi:HPr kinase/phosphorylase [Ligilactobacillus salitolerans]|uniref:HPr kinase/phosphorylase n=1 Tax=Ligilactobacillus salitolerans TaxID=1808352 RepID=A0A401IV63_9LACO|nr:HPr(Ser) kinase/phosphatase [Ligilactobacillus salitolerans]GBG95395.1 HPr kinase/phosphorylase [Ligilactobacillus salitolerans]
MNKVSVKELVDECDLVVFSGGIDLESRFIVTSDISRPGLEMTGYFDYYPSERIQLLGMTEISFAHRMKKNERERIMDKMCGQNTPCFLVSRFLPIPVELEEAGKRHHIPILRSKLPTTRLSSRITDFLQTKLSERRSVHGVLMDIYGLGVLITGDSGVGKSETALDLIKRGHRLIADDRVEIYRQDEQTLVGEAPEILSHLLEIRGVGIIDVMNLFGAGSVRQNTNISLIVNLENWSAAKQYDRLGSGEQAYEMFDVSLPKINIPVKVGRNMAIIIEAAAMNFRAKTMGYDATQKFEDNLNRLIQKNSVK